ncbi:MAG: hypothetical protein LBU12_08310 [Deltaproteobacteria bacterium]|jgi:lipopolysaccharide export system protein LptA|nr:hypothetical protein [Deltaproteobacteria bacterium]
MTSIVKTASSLGKALACLGLAWLAWSAPVQAADPVQGRQGPISITSDRLTADDNARTVTFTGRVVARQDDLVITCDVMRVHYQPQSGPATPDAAGQPPADRWPEPPRPSEPAKSTPPAEATVDAATDSAAEAAPNSEAAPDDATQAGPLEGGQEISRVECEGAVKIQQGDRLAVGQKAVYLAKSAPRRLILTGEARIWEGANSVTGHQVVYYLDENRSQVAGQDRRRVRTFFNQGGSGAKP